MKKAEDGIRHRKSPKGERRREEILNAAMRHFANDGYQSSSFAAIAEDVGLTLPGLLHYFPTKVDLLLAVLSKRDEEIVKDLTKESDGWRLCLLGLISIVEHNQTIPGVIRTFAILNAESITKDHPAENWFADRVAKTTGYISTVLKAGIKSGELRSEIEPDHIAAELIAIMDGLQMLWLRKPQQFDMLSVFSDYIHRLIETIEAPKP